MSAKVLDCGCLTGVYETYSGKVIQVVDAVGGGCTRHKKGDEVPREDARQGNTSD
ncbi:MAG TPA: hypothetical protein VMM93_14335 [Vicinamibacterales bacterium]|nr:hypothetical protein [Vicinamibacterales bacterium]